MKGEFCLCQIAECQPCSVARVMGCKLMLLVSLNKPGPRFAPSELPGLDCSFAKADLLEHVSLVTP